MSCYNFETNSEFERLHLPYAQKVLDWITNPYQSPEVPKPKLASLEDDLKHATDIIRAGDRVGFRVRRKKHRRANGGDFSVRVENKGYETEVHKIRRGCGRYYLYSFSLDDAGGLECAWLVSLERLRERRLLERDPSGLYKYPVHQNGDGTAAMYIQIEGDTGDFWRPSLRQAGCIVGEWNYYDGQHICQ